jgi:hypothetical protein
VPVSKNISTEIKNTAVDVRAEVIVDQLLQHNMQWNELFVHCNKFFYRNFSKDIFDADLDVDNNYRDVLHINLSRAGLYDILPEGLFFQPSTMDKKPSTAAEMAQEYKTNKKQELEIRKFFSPLENEFFYHRYKVFNEEKKVLSGLNNEALNAYFIKFWNLAKNVSPKMALKIVLLLPHVHQIAGNAALMANCLQNILEEPVTCAIENFDSQQPATNFNILGNFELGNELICGNHFFEDEVYFTFKIGPLKHSAIQSYLQQGKLYNTLQSFFRFFVPINAGTKIEIAVNDVNQNMRIGTAEEATLGIATVI